MLNKKSHNFKHSSIWTRLNPSLNNLSLITDKSEQSLRTLKLFAHKMFIWLCLRILIRLWRKNKSLNNWSKMSLKSSHTMTMRNNHLALTKMEISPLGNNKGSESWYQRMAVIAHQKNLSNISTKARLKRIQKKIWLKNRATFKIIQQNRYERWEKTSKRIHKDWSPKSREQNYKKN